MSTAAKTPNYNLSQVAGPDTPDWITDYTSDMSKIDDALKENADDIATVRPDEFSEESTYAAGDYCIKDNVIYKAKTAVEAGAFDISDWTATTIFDELSGLNQKIPVFSFGTLTANGEIINSGHTHYGMCAKYGKLVIVKAYFNCGYMQSGTPMFYIPDGFKPKSESVGMFIGWRSSDPDTPDSTYAISVNTDGQIYQSFNSDGSSNEWHGDIFFAYEAL